MKYLKSFARVIQETKDLEADQEELTREDYLVKAKEAIAKSENAFVGFYKDRKLEDMERTLSEFADQLGDNTETFRGMIGEELTKIVMKLFPDWKTRNKFNREKFLSSTNESTKH